MEKFEIKFIGNVINTKTNNRIRIEKLVEVNEKDYFEANKVSKLSVQYQKEYLNRVIPYYFPNCTPVSDENMSFKTFKISVNTQFADNFGSLDSFTTAS